MTHPSSLHLCNLANVAYGYCKILDSQGYPLQLRCHDLTHLMSQPEWDDLELRAEDFPDEWDFYTNTADFGDYRRPSWYRNAGILPEHINTTVDEPEDEAEATAEPDTPNRPSISLTESRATAMRLARQGWDRLPEPVRRRIKPQARRLWFAYSGHKAGQSVRETLREYDTMSKARFDYLIERSKQYGPEFTINRDMLRAFQPHVWWTKQHLRPDDILFAYVLTPIYGMLLGEAPYVSVEIGTMRDIPFDGTDTGKMLALAYRMSHQVLITNPDVSAQADELGIENYRFCPHPLDEDVYIPGSHESAFRRELLRANDADFILFAPARQNWEVKGNDRYLDAFARLLQDGTKAVLIIPGWGQEVERSQRRCRQLGIADRVKWIPPQSEAMLTKYYKAADFVLDQFQLGVFGLTTPKAMSCGAVVVTSYRPEVHDWAFAEHPPLVPALHAEEIHRVLADLCADRDRRMNIGEASREWVVQHHSKKVISGILDEAMVGAREAFARERS